MPAVPRAVILAAVAAVVVVAVAVGLFILPEEKVDKKVEDATAKWTAKSYCERDTDCICGGWDMLTEECFVGNIQYYEKYVNKTRICPDFCTGIAGNLVTRCVENKCQLVMKK